MPDLAKCKCQGYKVIFSQCLSLLLILLRLKLWRSLFVIVTLACLPSHIYIYSAVRNMYRQVASSYLGLTSYGASSLTDSGVAVTVDNSVSRNTKRMLDILHQRGVSTDSFIHNCKGEFDCKSKFFNLLHSRIGPEFISFVNFNDTRFQNTLNVECKANDGGSMGCPHLIQLAMQAASPPDSVFKDVRFISLIDQPDREKNTKNMTGQTVCDELVHKLAFPIILLIHMMLVSTGVVLYIIMGNLACISKMKESGFLQLMFQNGLSVSSYWAVVWTVTAVEMLVFAGVTTASFGLQCPKFYPTDRLLLVFVGVFVFCIYLASLTYLSSVIIKSYFLQVLMMILINIVICVMVLVSRILLSRKSKRVIRDISLVIPGGHVAEFLSEALMHRRNLSGYPLAILMMMLVVTAIVVCLTLLLDFLVDSGNGLKLPASFMFDSRFWRASSVQGDAHPMLQLDDSLTQRPNVESVPDTYRRSVQVNNLCKSYQSRKLPCMTSKMVNAVKGVTCAIYEDQITALIGHNGAGKTTLIKVLIGNETPSSGIASIGNCRITDPLQRLGMRGSIGVCHQTNVLSSSLTVQQTIELTLISKGLRLEDEMEEAMQLLMRLDMQDKRNVRATSLSGGQKRKLCTILALLGRPKVVFLDEPTSGLDPVSRRHLWQILQEYKIGRSIILCTQFMDEADILADRKIFISDGSLICAGSSLFLKHAFGCGFVLNVSLKVEKSVSELMRLLKKACNGVELKSQFKTEMELQMSPDFSNSVPAVLRILETRDDLVEAFGLSQSTLDEIFMRLRNVSTVQLIEAFKNGRVGSFLENNVANTDADRREDFQRLLATQAVQKTSASVPKQFSALMGMNVKRLKRTSMKLCCRFIFPAILLLALFGGIYLQSLIGLSIIPVITNRTLNRFPPAAFSGVCIADYEEAANIDRGRCMQAFSSMGFEKSFSVLLKSRATELDEFLLNSSTLSALNATCNEEIATICGFAYSSSWEKSLENNNRSLQVGIYRSDRTEFNFAESVSNQVTVFLKFSRYFGSAVGSTIFFNIITPISQLFSPQMGIFTLIQLLSIIPVTYISDPIEDKESRVRYQLSSMGMSSISYWLNTYLLHWLQYAVFIIISTILFVAILSKTYANAFFVLGICLPLLLLGTTSNQITVYAIGSLMKQPNPIVTIVYFFFVYFLSFGILLIQLNEIVSLVLIWCLPPFASMSLVLFGTRLAAYAILFYKVDRLADVPNLTSVYFSNPMVVQSLVATMVHIVILSVLVMVLEKKELLMSYCKSMMSRQTQHATLATARDAGVEQEVARLETKTRNPENVLEVRSLEKTYPNGVKAVKGVTFGCVAGEIFGLLGPNGAGKTTTLSVVVGEEVASAGSCEVRFNNAWMSGNKGATIGAIGYCPQHNPLFNNITVMEHLSFYAKIRGVPPAAASKQIDNLVEGLGLSEHRNKRAEQLSGGNKRRLCLAISLLGNPSVVVIDEASTGVDPEAKRFIWSAIRAMVSDCRSVVVTTHSMEEVEALCSRVAIMSHGRVIAFGTIQQLRSRYGHAYTLDILLNVGHNDDENSVKEKKSELLTAIKQRFNDCRVVEDLATRLQLLVPQESIGVLSDAFQWLVDNCDRLHVRYFTFYQMSLDQVFVRLIKEHEEAKAMASGNQSTWTLA